eukprot:scaffold2413_cov52-Phaeocystis_antarctica.AAC.1
MRAGVSRRHPVPPPSGEGTVYGHHGACVTCRAAHRRDQRRGYEQARLRAPEEACPVRFEDSLARKGGAGEGLFADGLERGGFGDVELRETGVTKGPVANRGDGGPHLEGAGELGAVVEGAAADGLERGGLGEVDPREIGVKKGVGADRGDGGPNLERAGD